ncbi:MAG: lipoyl synthase, partial [Planctomycetales bacterium]|nr:lipoyl synthase [Planctomycetales bacterium]
MSENTTLPIVTRPQRRLPEWLRVNLPAGIAQTTFNRTSDSVHSNRLHTVCEEARCPNVHDCWSRGTATFMVAGKSCTRGCRFCSVETLKTPAPPDPDEPAHLAAAVAAMGLEHVVITVVNRDDLADGGAAHYRACVEAVHDRLPATSIELLSSDLDGNHEALAMLVAARGLDVLAHNVECVERLDSEVRDPRASFAKSLEILRAAKQLRGELWTKSSLMVGLGETDAEIDEAMQRLRDADVDIITLGQYLAPGRPGTRYLPVARYVPPEQFARWETLALSLGFRAVASGPLVRSSFRAGKLLATAKER